MAQAKQRVARRYAWRIFVTCYLVYVLFFATNIVREIYPALSLGDHLSFDVSQYVGLHPDIFEYDGRAFINSNPGVSILAAVPYVIARPVIDRIVGRVQQKRAASQAPPPTFDSPWPMAREFFRRSYEHGYDIKFGLAAAVMQAGLMAPLAALSAVLMFFVLHQLTNSMRAAAWLSLLYAFATPIFYRTATLNQNVLVSHMAFFAFVLLWRPWGDLEKTSRLHYLAAGLLCGWAVVCDYSGIVVAAVLGIYGLVRRSTLPDKMKSAWDAPLFVAGLVASGAVLADYQWYYFGHPFQPAQALMPDVNYSDAGFRGMSWPQLDLLWSTAFDLRYGLFVSAPILLLALYVPDWLRERRLLARAEFRCVMAFVTLFFLFCAANQFGRMQFNTGVRHILPVVPFLFLLTASTLLSMPRWLAAVVSMAGTVWMFSLAMYRDVEVGPLGVFDSVLTVFREGLTLPWLTTLERMDGILPASLQRVLSVTPILCGLVVTLIVIWYPFCRKLKRAA